ncbi:MAG: PAS domain-containing protein [Desulfobulbaceae bacterium]|nr:PAS domain-containing protein [Desulfobulbaceae bacterium]
MSIDFVVQRVNKAFCRYVGGRESQLVGRRCYELYQEERCNTDECTMRLLQSGVPEVIRYMDEILPNGRRLTCSIHSVPYRDVHGNLLGQISSLFDLSERRKAEDDLEKTRRQLLHAEKLHAVGSLSASIAHEFNNPLCGVINVLGRISRKGTLPEGDRTMLGLALNECERMKRLILDLQNFNRPTSGKTTYFDLHRTIDDILLMAKKELAVHNVLVSKEYAGITVVQCGIEDQIRQVILNLVKNSIDAMEGGGTISISTSVQEDAITIAIQDTGRGITPEAMEHIFEPFFTTKEAVKGSGLGLSVSYGIIKSHGGDISVSSQPGKGTTFTVSLPAYKKNNGTNP